TAKALTLELTALRKAGDGSALWERLITLYRQQHDVDSLVSEGYNWQLDAEYEATLEQFLGTIPKNSILWFCFGWDEYLRAAVGDVIAYEAVGEPFQPYGAKMLRCAPGNRIILTHTFTPLHYFDEQTTQAHRNQVDNYVKQVRSLDNGKHRPRDM